MELAHSGYLVPLEYVNTNSFLSTKGFCSFLFTFPTHSGGGGGWGHDNVDDHFVSALLFCD